MTIPPEQQAELAAMIKEGNKSCSRLHELNDSIPGEAITEKLNTTEKLLTDIFARVKEHPEQMKNCHKLMDYHLPTMLKLVEAYGEYDKVSVPGDDIIKAKFFHVYRLGKPNADTSLEGITSLESLKIILDLNNNIV